MGEVAVESRLIKLHVKKQKQKKPYADICKR